MADTPELRDYALIDPSEARAPLGEVLQRMSANAVRYALLDYGVKLVAYANDSIAEALKKGAKTLDGVTPYRTWEGNNTELMRHPRLDVRKPVGICSRTPPDSTPVPPASLGATCRCGHKIVMIV